MQLFVEQLTNVDFSYLHAGRGLVGETWWASATLDGAPDDQGMICDFGTVKKTLRNWLDSELDHRLLVPLRSPALSLTQHAGTIGLQWQYDSGEQLSMSAPEQAVALVDAEVINAESVSRWCREQLRSHFPGNVGQLELSFAAEHIEAAFYHYSHGLKKHAGNCQRIAHGHRSRIQIWLDDQRAGDLETFWAERWADVYLGSHEDLTGRSDGQLSFHYHAQQGEFAISLPAHRCYLMDSDTTVEYIACHLAQKIKSSHPQSEVRVRAFEGVNKGAVASA